MPNQKIMNLKLTRGQVCDLMIAASAAKNMSNDEGRKWEALHKLLKEQLDAFDEKMKVE